jgi:hypothetical protein
MLLQRDAETFRAINLLNQHQIRFNQSQGASRSILVRCHGGKKFPSKLDKHEKEFRTIRHYNLSNPKIFRAKKNSEPIWLRLCQFEIHRSHRLLLLLPFLFVQLLLGRSCSTKYLIAQLLLAALVILN